MLETSARLLRLLSLLQTRLGLGATLPPLLLDDDETVAVAIGLRGAALSGVTGIEETAVRALAILEQMLPSDFGTGFRCCSRRSSRRHEIGSLGDQPVHPPGALPAHPAQTLGHRRDRRHVRCHLPRPNLDPPM